MLLFNRTKSHLLVCLFVDRCYETCCQFFLFLLLLTLRTFKQPKGWEEGVKTQHGNEASNGEKKNEKEKHVKRGRKKSSIHFGI